VGETNLSASLAQNNLSICELMKEGDADERGEEV